MEINRVIEEATFVSGKYNLKLIEADRTDNVISLKLLIDNELFIQIYGNEEKDKLNLALVFKQKRLYGYDSEGGEYHCHPFDDPDNHMPIEVKKSVKEFVEDSMRFIEKHDLL